MPKEKESLYTRKYRVAWESDAELKGWIGPVLADETKSLCKICKCTLAAHKKDLLLHGKSKKHQEAEKRSLTGSSKKITEFMKKDSKYSLIIDESTAVDSTKMLCVMIKYFSKKQTKIVTTFYKLIEIEKGDAITISAAVTKQLELDGLKLGNLIGIGVNGANVMVGAHNSVASFLKAKNNELVIIKCVCHSLHLAAEYAFKLLPRHLDFIIKECHNWFSCSTKRQIAYKQIFETLTDQKPLKIDQLSGTRWLARYNAIVKILEQWDALKIHFGIVKDNERPPRGSLDVAVGILDNTLSTLAPSNECILVLDDLNVNFFIDNKINQCFQSYSLHQLLNEPTRIIDHSSTLLDPMHKDVPKNITTIGLLTYIERERGDHRYNSTTKVYLLTSSEVKI
ncbi:unnamed protein product [Acanthoscelides obtectus]|uniref:DUF4371 domain-containing protein n=1 Tax=Acanthoscelides obtectus TaxID=200917 RepID=A0A9P0LZC0_ACAOB|nr:unnamed protein product [Acanthoscelides obtectus]CAK1621404.1 Zinc finger protein 862 [Acanthoscelides obtectus]